MTTADMDLLAQALYHAPCGAVIASTSADGTILWVNADFTRITGYGIEDVPDVATWLERAYPDTEYRAMVAGHWERDVSQPGRDVFYQVTRKDGQVREMLLRAALLPGERMVVTLLDHSESARYERELRVSRLRYQRLHDALPVGVVVHHGDRIDVLNPGARRILAIPEDVDLESLTVLQFVHPDDRARVGARIGRLVQGGAADWEDERFLRYDGSVITVEVHGSLIDWEGEAAVQVVFVDLSERLAAEEERRALEGRMQQAQRLESLAVLAGGVAHDFNNLLVGILGNADLALLDLPTTSPVRTHLQGIELAARRAADLAQQMLAYSGKGRFVLSQLHLRSLVEETAKLMGVALTRNATVSYHLDHELPTVEGDPTQLRQVVMNLLVNAAEAMEDRGGTITVTTGTREIAEDQVERAGALGELSPGTYCTLEIADTGVGMTPEVLDRIFDPFYTTKFAGRGLGLAAVLGIVKGHGGSVEVTSAPGQGTRFLLSLPAHRDAPPREEPAPAPGHTAKASGTVLVVDDEQTVRQVAQLMLEHGGYRVLEAKDGPTAVSLFALQHDQIDCVLLDLSMPGRDGFDTYQELARIRPDVRVVLSSGYTRLDATRRFGGVTLAGFVQKPYRATALLEVIAAALA